ncbi:hypothetical protein CJU80_04535 [Pseudomonas fragi]|nr:hypothetical protein CJF37_06330 [Pseudomonas fragi]PAA43964.1 hypothetical protein CJU80_04535 [Pseudomonas fragi]
MPWPRQVAENVDQSAATCMTASYSPKRGQTLTEKRGDWEKAKFCVGLFVCEAAIGDADASLFECKIYGRHFFSVGAGLARDAGTSCWLDDRGAAIASKPAPTKDWRCFKFLLLL